MLFLLLHYYHYCDCHLLPCTVFSLHYTALLVLNAVKTVAATMQLDRFPDPLPMGSGTGVQCLPKLGIFLFRLAQHKIGFGWESMAHIRKPPSIAKPLIHSLSFEQEHI